MIKKVLQDEHLQKTDFDKARERLGGKIEPPHTVVLDMGAEYSMHQRVCLSLKSLPEIRNHSMSLFG